MKRILFIFSITSFFYLDSSAQRNDNNWLWGEFITWQDSIIGYWGNAEGNFDSNSLATQAKFRNMPFDGAAGYFSNDEGQLLLYTNGMQIKDTTGVLIENGDSINYDSWWDLNYQNMIDGYYGHWGPREVILFYQPGSDSVVYMIHEHPSSTNLFDNKLRLSKVSVKGDSVYKVTKKNRVISPHSISFVNTAACKHGNGRDWWILFTEVNTNCIVKLLVTPDTILEYERQCIGDTIQAGWGCKATFSLDGTKFANSDSEKNGINIFDFDRCSGALSNLQHIPPVVIYDTSGYVISSLSTIDFSPDNKLMYVILGITILQFDLESAQFPNDFDTIAEQDTYIDSGVTNFRFVYFSSTYGPDGKLYIGPAGAKRFLYTINNPNGQGVACDFRMRSIQLPKRWQYTAPNIPNYRLGRLIDSDCDTIYNSIRPIYTQAPWLKVYPNPATDMVRFDYNWVEWERIADCELRISDLSGKIVLSHKVPKYSSRQDVSVRQLAEGVYTVELQGNERQIAVAKLTKQ